MKKVYYLVVATLLALVGIVVGSALNGASTTLPVSQSASIVKVESSTDTPAIPPVSATQTTPDSSPLYEVVRVVDGDTIKILLDGKEETVRLIGVDTPETVDPRKAVQCFGIEASKKTKEWLADRSVRIEIDPTQFERDKYSRLLAYVYRDDGLFVNRELIAQGFAHEYTYNIPYKYQSDFQTTERAAREEGRGLWMACPVGEAMPSSPASASASPDSSCTIKGNINASGEKIYHLPGCGSYTKTTIDASRGERMLCTEAEAQQAGWRKALNCS
ncbi:MAG: nuclease [Candidatus Vogelbacteria bacterium CG10_big_fil_rev_8_21_14_0_10_45_14]|uniref:Nuclease n=1 Tax=Candidatus Vogelbacteria bacterium CG10_big_fil_rev_8_21_14_0_10_45_14 TaxID=1975042 RepID=A0A2H0RJ41_9BACT|nr:MAG: nuclease [Candidatus Vogelbacteria bacterium CG10_big_fil_rev_8_21_14_0_10_45_14]